MHLFIYLNIAQWCRTNTLTLLHVHTKVEELMYQLKNNIYVPANFLMLHFPEEASISPEISGYQALKMKIVVA